jgi:preprotein translocase subunit SecA
MDELKQSVQLAVHTSKRSVANLQIEAFNLFRAMIDNVSNFILVQGFASTRKPTHSRSY